MYFTYLLIAFAAITAVNCIFYLLFLKFGFSKQSKESVNPEPLSVIVYVKNHGEILEGFLNKLIAQSHSNFEFVLVNNASYDNSLDVLEHFQQQNSNVQIVDVENNEAFWGSKKYALTLGIKKAKYANLLFVTPTAEMISENWFNAISSMLDGDKQLIIGYENFEKKKGFIGKLMRYNRFQSFMQNFGFGSFSAPYFSSENNLAYTTPLFFGANGFSTHMSIPSGTENLFIKEASTGKNTLITACKESSVLSKMPSFKDWFNKAKFHQESFKMFPGGIKFSLTLLYVSQLLFWVGAIAGGIYFQNLIWFALIGVRFLIVGFSVGRTAFKFGEKDLFFLFPFLEITNVFTQLFIFIGNLFSKPVH